MPLLNHDQEMLGYFNNIFQLVTELAVAAVPQEARGGVVVAQKLAASCLPARGARTWNTPVAQKLLSEER